MKRVIINLSLAKMSKSKKVSEIKFEIIDHLTVSSKMFFDDVLHDNSVEGDISSCQDLFVNQLRFHEVIEGILVFRLYFRKHTFICLLS